MRGFIFAIFLFLNQQLFASSGSEVILSNISSERFRDVFNFLQKRSFDNSVRCEEAVLLARTAALTEECLDENLNTCDELCASKLPQTLSWEFAFFAYFEQINSPNLYSLCEFNGGLELFSKKLYQDKDCEKGRFFKTLGELQRLFSSIDKKSPFEVPEPKNNCYERAVLLANYLSNMGISSNLIQFVSSPALGDMILPYKGKEHPFINHWVIEVKLDSGESYILDPQFQDRPISFSDFPKHLTKEKVEIVEYGIFEDAVDTQNVKRISYGRYHPFTNIYVVDRKIQSSRTYNSVIVPSCSVAKEILKTEALRVLER